MERHTELVIFSLLLVIRGVLPLYMPISEAMKQEHETFMVICRDEAGQSVEWRGPKGNVLGAKSKPYVEVASYGTALVFKEVTIAESGIYSCHSKTEVKKFNLTVLAAESVDSVETEYQYRPPTQYKPTKPPHHQHYTPITSRYPTSTDTTIDSENEDKIEFLDKDTNITESEGKNVFIRCEVKGSNEVIWYIEGNTIEPKNRADNKYVIAEDGLLINNVTREDTGNYVCSALSSIIGETKTRTIYLNVQYKPVWKNSDENEIVYGVFGEMVNLTCEVEANPTPGFDWRRRGSKKVIGKHYNDTILEQTYKSVLQIMVSATSLDDYVCRVKNPLGRIEKRFTIRNGTLPNPPQFIEVKGENSNLIDLGIQPPEVTQEEEDNKMAPIGFNVIYRPENEEEWMNKDFNLSEENSYPLLELKHDTVYEVAVATRNLVGLSEYTNSSFFRTLSNAVDAVYTINSSVLNVIFGLTAVLMSVYA